MKSYRRDLERLCQEYGWVIAKRTGSGHLKLVHPHIPSRSITCPCTASDYRALLNIRSLMRRIAAEARA